MGLGRLVGRNGERSRSDRVLFFHIFSLGKECWLRVCKRELRVAWLRRKGGGVGEEGMVVYPCLRTLTLSWLGLRVRMMIVMRSGETSYFGCGQR